MTDDATTTLPERHKPASGVFVSRNEPTIVFVTVCTKNRRPWLTQPAAHDMLCNVWREARAWVVGFYLLMPDHIHLFCSPGHLDISLDKWIAYWKSLFKRERTKLADIEPHNESDNHADLTDPMSWRFQSLKWDTRLRRQENYSEKWEYVRHNPIRKGWVAKPEDWPYQGELNELRW